MRIIYGSVLGLILFILFYLSYKRTKDLCSPLCIFSTLTFLRYVPNIMFKEYETFQFLDSDNTFYLFIFELLAIFFVFTGYCFYQQFINGKKTYVVKKKLASYQIKQWKILLVFGIGMIGRINEIIVAGGIQTILENPAVAYASLVDGTGIYSLFSGCAILAVMLQLDAVIHKWNVHNKKFKWNFKLVVLILMIFLYCVSYLIFTRRSPVLEYLLFIFFGFNYLFKPFKLKAFLKPKLLITSILLIVIVIVSPQLRKQSSDVNINLTNIAQKVVDEFTYVGRDTLIYKTFDSKDYWYGSTYASLLTAFIPYNLYPDKPPVDDGVYITNIAYGYYLEPPVKRTQLMVTYSIPFSTPSILYANFGVIGIIIGCFLIGCLYARFYKIVLETRDVLQIIIYQLVVYQLELSSLSIMQTLVPIIACYIPYKLLTDAKLVSVSSSDE